MSIAEARCLRVLESDNARLKRPLSERTLELDALNDGLKKGLGPSRRQMLQQALLKNWGLSVRRSC
jgi:hypothetical protein